MTRQMPTPQQPLSSAELESRVRNLEVKVARLTDMVKMLMHEQQANTAGTAAK